MTEVPGAMARPPVVSHEEWQRQRDELLRAEKEATRALDALAARRRTLPMVKLDRSMCSKRRTAPGPCSTCSTAGNSSSSTSSWTTGPPYCPGCTHFTNNVADLAPSMTRESRS